MRGLRAWGAGMTPWGRSLLVVMLVSAVPLAAIFLLVRFRTWLGQVVARLVPLAAGALLGAPLFHLIPEALSRGASSMVLAGGMSLGAIVFLILDRTLHASHAGVLIDPARLAPGGGLPVIGLRTDLTRVLPLLIAGDALHNAVDGALIAAAYLDDPALGVVTGLAIGLHELPRELGTFAVLVAAGASVRQAILVNIGTALLAAGSAVATLSLGREAIPSSAILLAIGAGTFVYLGAVLVVHEARSAESRREAAAKVAIGVLGLLLTSLGRHAH
jgi:zinc and cadmium transporter